MIVNKVLPFTLLTRIKRVLSYTEMRNVIEEKQKLLIRLFVLFASSLLLIVVRFSIMGFRAPIFQLVDNPASFIESMFLRILNYNYIYCLNVWLLICPEWLCFDWSMGCVPLITTYDKRIFFVFIFWLVLARLIVYAFSYREGKGVR